MKPTIQYGDDKAMGRVDPLWRSVLVLGGINSDIMLHPIPPHPSQASIAEC